MRSTIATAAGVVAITALLALPLAWGQPQTADFNIALLPDPATEKAILELSRQIARIAPSKLVLNQNDTHAHVTLYLAGFPTDAVEPIRRSLQGFDGKVAPTALVKGGTITKDGLIMMGCEATDELKQLHQDTLTRLNPLRGGATAHVWLNVVPSLTAQQSENLRSIGYPYGRELWWPHFTVASISPEDTAKVKALVDGFNWKARFDRIGLSRSDDQGRFVKTILSVKLRR